MNDVKRLEPSSRATKKIFTGTAIRLRSNESGRVGISNVPGTKLEHVVGDVPVIVNEGRKDLWWSEAGASTCVVVAVQSQ